MRWSVLAAVVLVAISGCDSPPPPPAPPDTAELWRFDGERIRRSVDAFKSQPTRLHRREVETAFAEFDRKLVTLRRRAGGETGDQRTATETRIAAMLRCREIQRMRCMATPVPVPVRAAQRIVRRAERITRR